MKKSKQIIFLLILLAFSAISGCITSSRSIEGLPLHNKGESVQHRQLRSTAALIEGKRLAAIGDYEMAQGLFYYSHIIDSTNAAAFYEIAKINVQLGNLSDAQYYAEIAIRKDPDNIHYHKALSDVMLMRGLGDEGFAIKKNLAKNNPFNLHLQLDYLNTGLSLGKYDEALTVVEHIENTRGFSADNSIRKIIVLSNLDKKTEALAESQRLISQFPNEPEYLEVLAGAYFEADSIDKAHEIYKQLLEQNPANQSIRLSLATLYGTKGEFEKAFDELKIAFQESPMPSHEIIEAFASFATICEDSVIGCAQKAFELNDLILDLYPDNAYSYGLYAYFLSSQYLLDEARHLFVVAVQMEPHEAEFWHQILSIDSWQQNYRRMLGTSKAAMNYIADDHLVYYYNGVANLYLGNHKDAIAAFKRSRSLAEENLIFKSQITTLVADTYFKSGKHRTAFLYYDEALTINPENAIALNNYSYHLALLRKNLNKALEMSKRANLLDQNNASFQDTHGWIYYKLGKYQEAKVWLEKALESKLEPNATILEHLGDVLYKLGDKERALYFWEKALAVELGPFDTRSKYLERKVRHGKLFE